MSFDLQRIMESKQRYRRAMAARPVAEKLAMLDALRARSLALRGGAAATGPANPLVHEAAGRYGVGHGPGGAFEFHDSVLAGLMVEDATCTLEFRPGYVHRSKGRPGIDAGEGFWQDLQIVISGAKVTMPVLALPVKIGDGVLIVGESRMANVVPAQMREEKKVALRLCPGLAGAEIEIEGTSIEIRTTGEARFAGTFPGTSG